MNTSIPLLFLFLFLGFSSLQAQSTGYRIIGTVVESGSQSPLEFATVLVKETSSGKAITGATTQSDGKFELQTEASAFFIQVNYLGFESANINPEFGEDGIIDLGRITLLPNTTMLQEVQIKGELSTTEFKLDKRIFHVGKDLSSSGASALEVLDNVPSVNVNIEGQVSLRGSSGVQILINGKPSVLASEDGNALGTITADMIDQIEVITNPSAKYDAEGTSGIINIVIKKEEREGINGSVSVNTGTPHNHSVGLSMNRRTEKFNLFTQLGVGYRELPSWQRSINQNLDDNSSIFSEGKGYRNETFYNLILGTDYYINKYNVITLSGNYAFEDEKQPSHTYFEDRDSLGQVLSSWERNETTEAGNPKWRYELQYKKEFEDNKDHTLLFSALGNFFGKDLSSEFSNVAITGTPNVFNQRTRTDFKEAKYTFNLDYTKPFNDKLSLEAGSQYVLQDVGNDYAVSDLVNGEFVIDSGLTNIFEFTQNVLGVYSTGAYEGEKWGVKLGLRLEHTDLKTLLLTTNQPNNQKYANLFPSAHTSYKINERLQIQAGYSRRIYRPRLWDLNPFFNIRNNFNIRTGNPELGPEFTDSYELSGIYTLGRVNLTSSVYHRHTTDVIERISTFENNVTTFKPVNIGIDNTSGIELFSKYTPAKWLTLNTEFNYSYFSRSGMLEGTSFDFSNDQWDFEATAKFKFPADFDVELTGEYESGQQTVQGNQSAIYFFNIGLRKKILNSRGVVSASVRDIFVSRIRESETIQPDFYSYSRRFRGRFMTLSFSYGFGKGEAMEYTGGRRR